MSERFVNPKDSGDETFDAIVTNMADNDDNNTHDNNSFWDRVRQARQATRLGLGRIADRLWEMVEEGEGPEYLDTNSDDYKFVVSYVRKFFDNPETDEELEELLIAYRQRLREQPNAENFAQRMPAMVYGQRPRKTPGSEESVYRVNVDRHGNKKKELIFGVRQIQAETLWSYIEKPSSSNGGAK